MAGSSRCDAPAEVCYHGQGSACSPWLALERPLRLADALRRGGLRLLGRHGGALWRDRERRVALFGGGTVLVSLLLTCTAPLWLLALGPVLLGVPHLFADLRYLVLRPGLHQRRVLWLLVLPGLVGLALSGLPAVGFLAMVAAALVARASWRRRLVAGAVALAICGVALCKPEQTTLWLAQLHNLAALVFFLAWRPRRGWWHLLPAVLMVLGAGALLLGAAEPVLQRCGGWAAPGSGVAFGEMTQLLAPQADVLLGQRLVLLFAFAQSVHYGLWLRLIPDEDRPRAAPRSFVASWRALRLDLSTPVCALAVLLSLGLIVYGLWDMQAARQGYLRVAASHGYLEFAAATLLLCEGRRPVAVA